MRRPDDAPRALQDLAAFRLPAGARGRPAWVVQLWWAVQATLFAGSPQLAYGWRRALLRGFGARIGRGARIRASVRCVQPWRLSVGDRAWIGDRAILYSLAPIRIGADAVVSQGAHLCAGSHDPDAPGFPLTAAPIRVGDGAWVAAEAFLLPGVTVGRGAVVGARALVTRDVPAGWVAHGHPARVVRRRGDRP
jgi:putative colanic acid biosynthesis acetyltransferase WcaF